MSNQAPQAILDLGLRSRNAIHTILEEIGENIRWIRVGRPLLLLHGPDLLKEISLKNYRIFLDLKINDEPQEVEHIIKSLQNFNIGLLSVKLSGRQAMLEAALKAQAIYLPHCTCIGANLLRNATEEELARMGYMETLGSELVYRFIDFGLSLGINGFICQADELPALRLHYGDEVLLLCSILKDHPVLQNNPSIQKASFVVIDTIEETKENEKPDLDCLLREVYSQPT